MEYDQLKISQKFDHGSSQNIRIRSAQPRVSNFNREAIKSAQIPAPRDIGRNKLTSSNPQIGRLTHASRGFSNDYVRLSRVSNVDKIAAIINKQDQFKREYQSKENFAPNYIRNFFDM